MGCLVGLVAVVTGINTLDLGKFKFEKELKNHNIGSHRYSIARDKTSCKVNSSQYNNKWH